MKLCDRMGMPVGERLKSTPHRFYPSLLCSKTKRGETTEVLIETFIRKQLRLKAHTVTGVDETEEAMIVQIDRLGGRARLMWWYGFTTYDEERDDPFELTAVLLKNLDVTQSILERAFSRNRTVTRVVLSALLQREKDGNPFYDRDDVRDLAKYLVQVGGVTIIDALSPDEIDTLVNSRIQELTAAGTAA